MGLGRVGCPAPGTEPCAGGLSCFDDKAMQPRHVFGLAVLLPLWVMSILRWSSVRRTGWCDCVWWRGWGYCRRGLEVRQGSSQLVL